MKGRSVKISGTKTLPRRSKPGRGTEERTDAIIVLALFVAAFTIRMTYLFQVESIPLFYHLPGDPKTYDDWAGRIAAGDWLGQGVFYQAPLYPYFLGLLRSVLGHDLWLIRVIQMALGSLSCGLLFLAGKLFFSRAVGIAAAIVLTIYAPGIFFNGLIDKPVLDVLLLSILLVVLGSSLGRPRGWKWVVAGGALALFGLSRENALILTLVLPPWIWLYYSASPCPTRLKWVLLFFAGLFVTLLPVAYRNLSVGGEFALTTSQLGANFFIGNNPLADGTYASVRIAHGLPQFEQKEAILLAEKDLGGPLTSQQVSSYWLERSWQFVRARPLDWLRLLARKWLIVWNAKEIEDSDDYYLYQRWSSLLKLLGWTNHFGFLAPLAAVGIFLTRSHWRRLWLLYAVLLALAGSLALFYIFGRYRISLVPVLAIFAGAGVVHGFSLWRERRVRDGLACVFLFALTAAVVSAPVAGNAGPSAGGYNNLSNALVKQGRVNDAIESLQQALGLRADYGAAHYNLGNLYASAGRLEEATTHLREATRLYPRFAEAHSNLGTVLARRGDLAAAIEEFRHAIEINPAAPGVHVNLGVALANQGNLAAAADSFERALTLNPESVQAHYYLGNLMASVGRLDKAIEHFQQVLRIEPGFADARASLARALAMQGKKG